MERGTDVKVNIGTVHARILTVLFDVTMPIAMIIWAVDNASCIMRVRISIVLY
jgi:hypothetical protein